MRLTLGLEIFAQSIVNDRAKIYKDKPAIWCQNRLANVLDMVKNYPRHRAKILDIVGRKGGVSYILLILAEEGDMDHHMRQ